MSDTNVQQAILDDVTDLEAKLSVFNTNNAALPGLKAASDSATSAYNAGLASAQGAANDVNTSFARLQSDIALVTAGGTPVGPGTPTVPGGGGGDTVPAGGGDTPPSPPVQTTGRKLNSPARG